MESLSKFVNVARQYDSLTENKAVTHSTTLNNALDLFFKAGACRSLSEKDIILMLEKSWMEDKLLTLKIIFWSGDIRGGAGERRFFRIALKWLLYKDEKTFNANIKHVVYYNRWDSLFNLIENKSVLNYIISELKNVNKNNLLFKWLPRKKQYNNLKEILRKELKLTPKQYRNLIVEGTKVVETKMCSKQWDKINYKQVPSVAFSKYKKAFYRNDEKRFNKFIEDAMEGKVKINAGAIFPHDIIKNSFHDILSGEKIDKTIENAIIAQWDNLKDYLKNSNVKLLPVCDVSGSMYDNNCLPLLISISLGIYLSERNNSIFKDAYITFSRSPVMNYLKGNVIDKIKQIANYNWGYNTDLIKTFDLILNTATKNKLSEKDMPEKLLIISDMEFDEACYFEGELKTNFEVIQQKYDKAGYKIPELIFWNVNSKQVNNFPISFSEENVALVSGASPSIVASVLDGEINPISVMLKTLNNNRYDKLELSTL